MKVFIWKNLPLWFHMEIRVLYEDYRLLCNSLQWTIVMILQDIMKNLFYWNIIRFRRNTSYSPNSLPCRGQEEPHIRVRILGRSKKWYSLKQGHWPIQFVEPLNFPDNAWTPWKLAQLPLPERNKKMLLKFSKLFPYTFLKWICLTRISLVMFLAKWN